MEILKQIQQTLSVPKNQFNSFGKYPYRSCEDILEAVKPLLGDAVLTISDEIVLVGDRVYVKATSTIKHGDESISVSAFAREDQTKKGMDLAQLTGSCSSYARKYSLGGLFLIDDTKDADTQDNRPKKAPQAPKQAVKPTESDIPDKVKEMDKDALLILVGNLTKEFPTYMEGPLKKTGLKGMAAGDMTKEKLLACIDRFNVEIVK